MTFDDTTLIGNVRSDDAAVIGTTYNLELVLTPVLHSQYIQPKFYPFSVTFGSNVGGSSCSCNEVYVDPADHEYKDPTQPICFDLPVSLSPSACAGFIVITDDPSGNTPSPVVFSQTTATNYCVDSVPG